MSAAKEATNKYDYATFSRLAGPFSKLPKGVFKVKYKRVANKKEARRTMVLAFASVGVELGFLMWLMSSLTAPIWNHEAAALSGVFIVPSKEPFAMVEKTLKAMKQVRHQGQFDVWLLDEGNDPAIRKACKKLGVHHFSRKDIPGWNTKGGRFATKTKHGNYNSWLSAYSHRYDYVLSVDGDHIPQANSAERMLGYFRDQDVAYVVGPQVYGNYTTNTITKGSESQSYVFQATIQRAANGYNAAMFVGTNHAYRVKTIMEVGGFQDSITEDFLTGLTVHTSRNHKTGNFWKSVYTPDVVAVGEGPSSWTDFFSQQLRWARGANEILLKNFAQLFVKLPWRAKLHYGLIVWCYPTAAITWALGIAVSMLYLFLGQTGVGIPEKTWLALYIDVIATQLFMYAFLRRFNVSPHEEKGSLGVLGIVYSIFAAPIYTAAFIDTILRKKSSFVVTPKGNSISPDTWATFKHHLFWAALVGGFLLYGLSIGNTHPNVKIWCGLTLITCLAPVIMWRMSIWRETKLAIHSFLTTPRKLVTRYQE